LHKAIRIFLSAALVFIPGKLWMQTSHPSEQASISAGQVSFYTVPLACDAARGLGCGSLAKPVLLSLEKKKTIQEAWLNHRGTTLAIVWEQGTNSEARSAEIQSLADDHSISLHELRGEQRDESLRSFTSKQGWYRGAEVDRLSEQEAAIIVGRLIRRAALKAPTIADKSATLKAALTKVLQEQLINCTSTQCREDCRKKLADVAQQNLKRPGIQCSHGGGEAGLSAQRFRAVIANDLTRCLLQDSRVLRHILSVSDRKGLFDGQQNGAVVSRNPALAGFE
jgi:hypothetical protein